MFWPGIYADLETVRVRCRECNVKQPSNAALPPRPLASPYYHFQMVANYCTIEAKAWLVLVDSFTGLVSVLFIHSEAKIIQEIFFTFGVAENITNYDRSQPRANEMETFLTRWGMDHRISSGYNPHSNRRSDTGVKTAKRPLMTGTKSYGCTDRDKASQALLQDRNTPIRDLNLSPAHLLFGLANRELFPVRPRHEKKLKMSANLIFKRKMST